MTELRFYLLLLLISVALVWFMNSRFDPLGEDAPIRKAGVAHRQVVTPSSINYDVKGLDELVGRLRVSTLIDRQARAYAELYGITKKDLTSNQNIFGEIIR